jgi:hypothetical protein
MKERVFHIILFLLGLGMVIFTAYVVVMDVIYTFRGHNLIGDVFLPIAFLLSMLVGAYYEAKGYKWPIYIFGFFAALLLVFVFLCGICLVLNFFFGWPP